MTNSPVPHLQRSVDVSRLSELSLRVVLATHAPNDPGIDTDPGETEEEFPGLAAVVGKLEWVQRLKHELESVEQTLLAQGYEIASAAEKDPERSFAPRGLAHRSVEAELAGAVRVTDQTMSDRVHHAVKLVNEYSDVQAALAHGEITLTHTRVIVDEGLIISDPGRRRLYERAVLREARRLTSNRLRPVARRMAAEASEASAQDRFDAARVGRCVSVTSLDDGMASLTAILPAVEAFAIWDKLSRQARVLKQTEASELQAQLRNTVKMPVAGSGASAEEKPTRDASSPAPRSIDQIRTDLFTDALLAGASHTGTENDHLLEALPDEVSSQISSKVQIVIPVMTLLGDTDVAADSGVVGLSGVAQLAGYGPIDPKTARRLSGTAKVWERLLVHPITGTVLEVDRYRPSEDMRRLLAARDQHCRFPGCRMPTWRCDIDHTIDYVHGGKTRADNLAHLCRGHHTLKHHGGWKVKHEPGGHIRWRSPTGRSYLERPPSSVMFTPLEAHDTGQNVHATGVLADTPRPSDLTVKPPPRNRHTRPPF